MRILLTGINYFPEMTGIGVYTHEFASYLADAGHNVEVVTTYPYYPSWKRDIRYPKKLYSRERIHGISVRRCYTYVPSDPTPFRRMLHEVIFSFLAGLKLLTLPRADLLICVSPTFTTMVAAALVSMVRRAPLHIHVQDLQPDAAIQLGMVRNTTLMRVLYWLERFAYRRAKLVSAIGEDMLQRIQAKGVPESKLHLFRNWVHLSWDSTTERENTFRKLHKLEGKFLVLYAGNMGVKQGLEVLVECAARAQKEKSDMLFLLVGDGSRRRVLEAQVKAHALSNVLFSGVLPRAKFVDLLSTADVSVLLQRKEVKEIVVPSKLLNILAAGSPIVVSVDSENETAKIVKNLPVDVVVPPGDVDALYKKITYFKSDPRVREELRSEERKLADRLFRKDKILPEVLKRLELIVQHSECSSGKDQGKHEGKVKAKSINDSRNH